MISLLEQRLLVRQDDRTPFRAVQCPLRPSITCTPACLTAESDARPAARPSFPVSSIAFLELCQVLVYGRIGLAGLTDVGSNSTTATSDEQVRMDYKVHVLSYIVEGISRQTWYKSVDMVQVVCIEL